VEFCSKTFLDPSGTVADAIRIIEESNVQICLVVDPQKHLLGTVTDGDVRRSILRSLPLSTPVSEIMRRDPRIARPGDSHEAMIALMKQSEIDQLPLCDAQGRVIGLVTLRQLLNSTHKRENWVLLMAGGLGERLRPLTDTTPKPMLKVGNKPLLETLLESFLACDFSRFYIAVNYKAEMIKEHFGDGRKWGCTIRYLEESERLGTAGALSLLKERPNAPLIVMNGDVLTKVNFAHLLDFHQQQGAAATMCVREYDFKVPYGVVEIKDDRLARLTEKPVHTFFVNAGIYVIDPDMLDLLVGRRRVDMTDLFSEAISAGKPTTAFPIREYWIDVGQPNDFVRANREFEETFR